MIKIVLLSGGIDSTGMLIKKLKETKDFIHVHHIRLINCEDRHDAEDKAVEKTIEYCRTIRDFGFSCSTFQFPGFNISFSGMDLLSVSHISAMVTRAVQNQFKMSHGNLYDVEVYFGSNKSEVESWEAWLKDYRKVAADKIFESNFDDYKNDGLNMPLIKYPVFDLTKKELLAYIPETLRPYVISCRSPMTVGDLFIQCGMCHSCIRSNEAYGGEDVKQEG